MLNFNRGSDRPPDLADSRNAGKPALRPAAVYEPPGSVPSPSTVSSTVRALPPDPAPHRDGHPGVARHESTHASAPQASNVATASAPGMGSTLHVGVNIKLKGVEISDCDLLVIEGHVEATVHSKEMQIAQPGTLKGTAEIDVAEVHGEFTGELTARTRLVVHGTGRVSGTIRYGRLIVADGGTISGDMKQIDIAPPPAPHARGTAHEGRHSAASARTAGG